MCVLILVICSDHLNCHYTEGDRYSKEEADERKLDAEGDSLDGKKSYTSSCNSELQMLMVYYT